MEKAMTIENLPDAKKMTQAVMTMLMAQTWVKIVIGMWLFTTLTQFSMPLIGIDDDGTWLLRPFIFTAILIAMYLLLKYATYNAMVKNVKPLEPQTFAFNDNGFTVTGQTYTTTYNWRDIPKIVETKDWFLIHLQKVSAFVLDKSQMTENQYTKLKQYFSELPVKTKLKS